MNQRFLSKNFQVSDLGYGAMSLSHGYGAETPKDEAIKILRQALDCGYTYFDTAEVYGPYKNEELVGEALKPYRHQVQISTKFGISFSEYTHGDIIPDGRPEVIRKSVEGSLKRLQTDYIDLYLQHRTDPKIEPETVAEVMGDLIKEGKILHWGVSMADADYIKRAHAVTPITAIQNRYSMMARNVEKLFPMLQELGIGLIAYSPLANGLLSGAYQNRNQKYASDDYRSRMPQFSNAAVAENRDLMAYLTKISAEHGATPAQVSLAWLLGKHSWITALPSSRKLERIVENAGGAVVRLSEEEIRTIDATLKHMPMSDVFGQKNN